MPEIGKYHLVAELARGGMGIVYLSVAHGPAGFNKLLVVKELKPEMANDHDFVAMFLDEARVAARLTHPNIVQTNEVGSIDQRHFIVMEFLDGRTLHRIVRRFLQRGGFPVNAHLRVIADVLLGLHYAHNLKDFDGRSLGIVHRDVSPHNVFLTFDGQAKVLDFGIAKAIDSSLETKTGVLKGRVAYMAPEQASGEKVDCRADVYAAGVMIWEAVARRRLWTGKTDVEILSQMLRAEPPRLRSALPDAPAELDELCARAMARSRDERYPTAAALHDDLEKYLASRPDVPTMRQIGALVTQAFTDERAQMTATIDDALSHLRGGRRSAMLPAVGVNASGTPSDARKVVHDEPSNASTQLVLTPPSKRPGARSMAPSAFGGLGDESPNTGMSMFQRWGPRRVALGSVLAVGVVIAVIVASTVRHTGGPPTAGDLAGGSPSESALPLVPPQTPAVPTADLVDVQVRGTPSNARISIDGTPAVGNPFRGRYPKDGSVHRIDVSADGYETKSEQVAFSQNLTIDMSLDRRVAAVPARVYYAPAPPRAARNSNNSTNDAPPPTAAVTAAQPPVPSPMEVNPAGGRPPLRPIDSSNPYGSP
jgi:serine/threonine protein kinase